MRSIPIGRRKPGQPGKPIRTKSRSATILPNFVGLKFQIHNGKIYHDVTITEDMVGHKLGEFSPYVHLNAVSILIGYRTVSESDRADKTSHM